MKRKKKIFGATESEEEEHRKPVFHAGKKWFMNRRMNAEKSMTEPRRKEVFVKPVLKFCKPPKNTELEINSYFRLLLYFSL